MRSTARRSTWPTAHQVLRERAVECGRVVIRRASVEDLAPVEAFYRRLSPERRQRRFFTAAGPSSATLRHWLGDPGNVVLEAVLETGEAERVVGEAGYAPCPDGTAEVGIAVEDGWHGWLGPLLLDALVEVAAHSGVSGLTGEILVTNGRMLDLASWCGASPSDHGDPTTVHVELDSASAARVRLRHAPAPAAP